VLSVASKHYWSQTALLPFTISFPSQRLLSAVLAVAPQEWVILFSRHIFPCILRDIASTKISSRSGLMAIIGYHMSSHEACFSVSRPSRRRYYHTEATLPRPSLLLYQRGVWCILGVVLWRRSLSLSAQLNLIAAIYKGLYIEFLFPLRTGTITYPDQYTYRVMQSQ
jgi:hypothetical protein